MGASIRRAERADLDGVRQVGLRTWPATYESFAGSEYVEHALRTWWSEEITLRCIEELHTFVAVDADQIVGMTTLGHDRDGQPVVWKLYVLPEHQGRGIGGALLDTAIAAAPEDGPVLIEYVEGNDRAAALYTRRGFVEIRRERERDDWPRTVWMRRPPTPATR